MDMDTVVVAIGHYPNPLTQATTPQPQTTKWAIPIVARARTSMDGIYARGDATTGEATVISAMEAGKAAARSIHDFLTGKTHIA